MFVPVDAKIILQAQKLGVNIFVPAMLLPLHFQCFYLTNLSFLSVQI
jgi:hypothetical protein